MKKKKLKKKTIIIIIACIVVLVVAALLVFFLVGKSDKKDATDNTVEDVLIDEEEATISIVDVNSTSRPFAVMINNLSVARPYHTGLQDAYLVYEIIVEGGITRYMALFKDKENETVGSVRSARHYYLDYALENDAYYVHWGWSEQAKSDISSLGVDNLNGLYYSSPYFYRQSLGIASEHTGYVSLKELVNLANKLGYRSETNKDLLLNYNATDVDLDNIDGSIEAVNVDLKYSNYSTTNYVYDEDSQVYMQYVNSKEHTDYETNEQYTVKNIIVYQVATTTIDSYGRQDISNIGTGEGYFISNGVAVPITWEKSSRSAQTVYRYLDGTEITVNDGNTWIHIVPTSGNVSIKASDNS